MHRQPFRTREARHVLPVNPAGHHLEPGIQSGITEEHAFSLHLEVKVATDVVDIIGTVPGFV